MGIAYNTSIVRSGLTFHIDAASVKSYPGNGTAWNDLSGGGKTATMLNGMAFDSLSGSMLLDGVDDYGKVTGFDSALITGSFSFSAWVMFNTLPSSNPRLLHFATDTNNIWNLAAYGGSNPSAYSWFWVERKKNGSFYSCAGTALKYQVGRWYNVVGTFNDATNTALLYVDSVQFSGGGVGGGAPSTYNELYVGSPFMNGKLSDLKIYSRELTATEVKQNFEALRGRYGI